MTTKGPEGRMTQPLATTYNVGDVVELVRKQSCGCRAGRHLGKNRRHAPRVGEIGVIRRIEISAPEDGDATFLIFFVKFSQWGKTALLGESDFSLIAKTELALPEILRDPCGNVIEANDPDYNEAAEAWLRRQLEGLGEGR